MKHSPEPPVKSAAEPEFSTSQLFERYAESHDADALQSLLRRVEPMLVASAARQIASYLQARFGPEDVTQSVLMAFVSKLNKGEFTWQGSLALRGLLQAMVNLKVKEYTRNQNAMKRSPKKEIALQATAGDSLQPSTSNDHFAAELQEELQKWTTGLMEHFSDQPTHLKVLARLFAGEEPAAIATELGKTVRRVKQIIADGEKFVSQGLLNE